MTDKMIRLDEVLDAVGVSESTLRRMIRDGLFPKSQKFSSHGVGWPRGEVDKWIARRLISGCTPGGTRRA